MESQEKKALELVKKQISDDLKISIEEAIDRIDRVNVRRINQFVIRGVFPDDADASDVYAVCLCARMGLYISTLARLEKNGVPNDFSSHVDLIMKAVEK